MFRIQVHKAGKKFNREWIFRHVDLQLASDDKLVILGGNGSGKSTLLQLISGYITPNEGKVEFFSEDKKVTGEQMHMHVALASPYLQLTEDFTAPELISHLAHFKSFRKDVTENEMLEIADLAHARNKFIKHYSSGMKQRLKLALAFFADTPLLLLDEPLSNLDARSIAWYRSMVAKYTSDRVVIVCSNAIADEYFFCTRTLNVAEYK